MAKMTGGKAVLESLKAHDVDVIFGLIMGHSLDIYDALYDSQDSITYIGGRKELACGHMADGYARALGKPGIVLTSTGCGAVDSMGSLAEAYNAGSPVLEVTTNQPKDLINAGRMVCHDLKGQTDMFSFVTDWNALVTENEAIPDYIGEAFKRFQTKRPRPIELEFPSDMLGQVADVEITPPLRVELPKGEPAMIEKAVEKLINARRPIIVLGDEVNHWGGTEEVIKLAESLGIPVITDAGGKGAFPEDHPLSLGRTYGLPLWGVNPVHEFLLTCDLALVVGTTLGYGSTVVTGVQLPNDLIHILLDEEPMGKNYNATVRIVANPKLALNQILSQLDSRDMHKGNGFSQEISSLREDIYRGLKEQFPNELYTLEGMRSVLPRDTITWWDGTIPAYRASRGFPIYEPRTFHEPHGWMGLGYAFPGALGAKVAKPETPGVCFTGDGGFQFNMQELATAAQYNINPTVVLFNDNAWGTLKWRQETHFDERYFGVDLVNPDFVKLVESYGLEAKRVETADELIKELGSAVKSNHFQFIEASMPNGFNDFR